MPKAEQPKALIDMAALGRFLRTIEGNKIAFWCPGCETSHAVNVGEQGGKFNNNAELPTFSPSVLVRGGHYADGISAQSGECWCTFNERHPESPSNFRCFQCHSFVTDGKIQYFSDCSHALAGSTIPLPPFP